MGRINVTSWIFAGPLGPNYIVFECKFLCLSNTILFSDVFTYESSTDCHRLIKATGELNAQLCGVIKYNIPILAEGAIALSVTHSGGALFASWKLLQFPSSLIVKVILAIFMGASAQHSYCLTRYALSWNKNDSKFCSIHVPSTKTPCETCSDWQGCQLSVIL